MIKKITFIEQLDPVNFAFVMATGVVSNLLFLMQWPILSLIFLILAATAYACLITLFLIRFFTYGITRPMPILTRLKWLTFSAASCDLAMRFALGDVASLAIALGIIGIFTGIILIYIVFCGLLFQTRTSLEAVAPLWLLISIVCHYMGIVISVLWEKNLISNPNFLLFAFIAWGFGILIYLLYMPLNIYRMFFLPFEGPDLHPGFWTCMGAAAIAVVDGCRLLLTPHHPHFIDIATPLLQGSVLLLWTWGTALIPILLFIEFWKYAIFKTSFRYQPILWAMVFPIGMYTQATRILYNISDIDLMQKILPELLWGTISLWCIIALGIFRPAKTTVR